MYDIKNSPRVSIVVPVYGVEKYIVRCAISLFEQTYENIEYVFINDCTQDNSICLLQKIINNYSNRKKDVKIIEHKTNKGLAGARNTGVYYATGDFIMHVDSDDYVDKFIVEKSVKRQIETDADIVVIDFIKMYSTFRRTINYAQYDNNDDYCTIVLSRKNSNSIWAKLIRRSLYTENDIKCVEGFNQGEDYQVVPKLLYCAKKIVNLKDALYFYDSSNEGAYSNSFTISKHDQNWGSMNVIRDFFISKGNKYEEAVAIGRLRQIADDFIISCKSKRQVSYVYYSYARKELQCIDKRLMCHVQLSKRIIIHLSSCFVIMKSYVLIMRFLNHGIMFIKSKIKII